MMQCKKRPVVCRGACREQVFNGLQTPALGADLTTVRCKGQWLPLGITVDAISGLALTIDQLSAEDIEALKQWVEPIAQSVGAQVLVTDDADGFKTVADEAGMQHQVCKSHVLRNTDRLIEQLKPQVAQDSDGSLKAIGVTGNQARADLERVARTDQESATGTESRSGRTASALVSKPVHLGKVSTKVWPTVCVSCFSIALPSGTV
jgi:hypothetical protein